MISNQLNRVRPFASAVLRRCKSASADGIDLPTRHSLKQPPRACVDAIELEEQTQKLLESPVGLLYANRATADGDRDDAYDLAFDTIQMAEYLQLGYARHIPGSMYAAAGETTVGGSSNPIASMQSLIDRMAEEGNMYMQLRNNKIASRLDEESEESDDG